VSDRTQLVASDYEVSFATATSGTVTRRSDGVKTAFTYDPAPALPTAPGTFSFFNSTTGLNDLPALDGLSLNSLRGSNHVSGNSFLASPFSTSASTIKSEFSSPRSLAVASPIAARAGSANTGTLSLEKLAAKTATTGPAVPFAAPGVTLTFDGAGNFTRSDTGVTAAFISGMVIESASDISPGWSITLKGAPQNLDTFQVIPQPGTYRNTNAGNAGAMMDLRDMQLFDGAKLTDGYAALIAQVGIRTQSANYAAEVSGAIAANLETDRTGVAGVNLDEEAAKLLQYQQAYQASAKMIQIAQSIFDTLIQTLGR
jgi:flagellar hook-associated protein 1 FlgK